MLAILAVTVVALLAAALGFQSIWCAGFVRMFRDRPAQPVPDEQLPKLALVMPLRGADPFLDRTLEALSQLDYPDYAIRIIIDNRADPAWELVQQIIAKRGGDRIQVEELCDRRTTCSLKMSALIQAVSSLDASYDVVAIIDADAVPYPGWLRDMVRPFADPQVGATSGVRWFMPEETNTGSLVRYIWNAAAAAQMHAFGIAWGGSMAVRTSLLRDAGILEKWSRIMFEDTSTVNEVYRLGKKLEYVPAATLLNRESIDVAGCTRFISRQVVNARFYDRSWPAIAAYAWLSVLSLNGALVIGAAALLMRDAVAASAIGVALAVYAVGMSILLVAEEVVVRRVAQRRGEPIRPLSWKLIGAGLLTHYVYLTSVAMALRVTEIEWRGIKYSVGGPRTVNLQHYTPYRPSTVASAARLSL